ncbi:vWA domain-containing protein [Actinomarinicola tropica]|uniref:VWA domain-containing protein n=1 Tax=Actinomarinicola tropica TaxID=2789776 RepID=A0A5Q2RNG6_9ACTN|nr:vWA domain-containing protein [Actinomarinicola tropica]QGG95637.1 VWA domain-containing protein [Actinomarinicola tropica]
MTTTWWRRVAALLVVVAVVLAACGGDGGDDEATDGTGRGWVDGEPDWESAADGAYAVAAEDSAGGGDAASVESLAGDDIARPGDLGPLRAGSVDDNADLDGFVAYLDRIAGLGIQVRPHDPRGRILVEVTGANGLPVAGAEVVVRAGGSEVGRLRTTADGTVRVHPVNLGLGPDATVEVATDGSEPTTSAAGSTVALTVDRDGGAEGPVPLDVVFLLDATGSMGDEIDRLRTTIDSVSERIAALESRPDVRFGMTLYRDEGDAFVTSTFDLTSDLAAFRAALAEVQAGGGGDYPEALDEGLADALSAHSWRDPAEAVQLVFLVADAPPQVGRDVPVPYDASIRDATGRGIKIFPVASSESDDQAEAVFRQLAQATGARFVFLSYGAGGAATGGSTDIASTDYEELALDELVVRLVSEELDALTGAATPVPTTTPPTTAPPQGQ